MEKQVKQIFIQRFERPCIKGSLFTYDGLNLKVHKRDNFLGFDFEICTFS